MSNLLPRDAKKAMSKMYRTRCIVAGSLVALIVAILSALSLLPSYLALHAAEVVSTSANTTSKRAGEADHAVIMSIKKTLVSLSPLLMGTTSPTTAITQALLLKPSGILIDHVTYSGGNPGTIMIVGTASTREAINSYRQALAADSHWKSVSIPVGDLTGAPGADFSLMLSGNF